MYKVAIQYLYKCWMYNFTLFWLISPLGVKGWVWANALRLSRASIYIEDTTTSTCWGSKCLWSQLSSFLLNLWAPPLVAIGIGETQGLRETMTLYRVAVRVRPWVAVWVYGPYLARRFASQPYRTKYVTFSPVRHVRLPIWLRPVTAKRANIQGGNVHIYLILLHRLW